MAAITNYDILYAEETADLCKRDLYGLRPHMMSLWWSLLFRKMVYDATILRASCTGYTTTNCNL